MLRQNKRIAVVMLTFNRRAEVLLSLQNLVLLPERPKIVLVDNGSSDCTAEAVRARFPRVEVIDAGQNLGAAGRNLGVKHVDTPYIAFCDDDTWWQPGALTRAIALFESHPRLAVATGRVLIGPDEREDPVCEELLRSPLTCSPEMPGKSLLGFLAGASVVRRSAFLEAGGYNGRFFIGGEEQLLAADLAALGWWLCYVPELVVHHYPSEMRDGHRRQWHLVRNALWFAWLRRPWRSALRRTGSMAWSGPWDRAAMRGFASALAGLPWVLRDRRVAPPSVEQGLCLLENFAVRKCAPLKPSSIPITDEIKRHNDHAVRSGPQGRSLAREDALLDLR
ncbi:MAG: glycosyltransferase family 2 protein [Gemmataceae bacterium]